MPYNPKIQNNAGAIYGRGITQGASAQAAGITAGADAMASGISHGASALAGGIEKAGQVWQQNALKKEAESNLWSALNTKIATMGQMGYLTPRDADALAGIKKPQDLAAALTVVEQDITRRQQAQRDAAEQAAMFDRHYREKQLEYQQKALEASQQMKPGQTKQIIDPVTKKEMTYVWTGAQLTPLPQEKAPAAAARKVEVDPGKFVYQDAQGNAIDPKKIVDTTTGGPNAEKIAELQAKRAEFMAEVAAGNKAKGVDAISLATPYADQIKGLDAQIAALQGGGQPAAAAPTPAAYQSANAVRSAVRSGQLSREEALKILREKFGL
jgi:hypothetical protein